MLAPFSASMLPYWCLSPWSSRNPFGSSALCLIRANTRPRLRQFHKFPFGVGKTNCWALSCRPWFFSKVIAPCESGSNWSFPDFVSHNKISARSKSTSSHSGLIASLLLRPVSNINLKNFAVTGGSDSNALNREASWSGGRYSVVRLSGFDSFNLNGSAWQRLRSVPNRTIRLSSSPQCQTVVGLRPWAIFLRQRS